LEVALQITEQAAKGLGDGQFIEVCMRVQDRIRRQREWLITHSKHMAPHTLVVPQ
jgi:hypothetical protein